MEKYNVKIKQARFFYTSVEKLRQNIQEIVSFWNKEVEMLNEK